MNRFPQHVVDELTVLLLAFFFLEKTPVTLGHRSPSLFRHDGLLTLSFSGYRGNLFGSSSHGCIFEIRQVDFWAHQDLQNTVLVQQLGRSKLHGCPPR